MAVFLDVLDHHAATPCRGFHYEIFSDQPPLHALNSTPNRRRVRFTFVRVTRIVVTELPPDNLTLEPWAVAWVNDLGDFRHVHHSKAAAQRHVTNLLKNLTDDQSRDDVLTVHYRD